MSNVITNSPSRSDGGARCARIGRRRTSGRRGRQTARPLSRAVSSRRQGSPGETLALAVT
eukprot:4701951-Pyramimonas_sp.AAC.1